MEKKWKNKNLIDAFKNAINGIIHVLKNERNFRVQFVFAIFATLLGIILKLNYIEFAIIIITIFLVFLGEFVNTIVEIVVDMYTEEYNEMAKNAKDVAAGVAMLMAICSIIIGIIIYLPKIISIIFR